MYATKFFLLLLYVQFSFGDITSTFENTKQKEEDVTLTGIDDQRHDVNDAEEDELLRDLDDVTSMFENTKQKEKDVTVTETAATSSVDSSYNNPASRVYSSDPKTNISRPTTKTTSNTAGLSSRFPVPPECMNYKLLNEANRAEGYSSKFRRTLCDKVLPKDWYRFTGDAGNKMPDFCVAKLRCGAHAPGWLNKSHPSMVDGVIDAKVCFHWGSNCCSWSTDVRVRNCGKFFVYQLQPVPLCSLRYCGNNRQVPVLTTPNAVTPSNDPSSPSLAKECKVYKTLNERDRSQSYLYNSDQGARPTCDRWLTRDWYRFTGLAGNRMPDKCVPVQRCGTLAPGWLQGGHPNVDAGVVSRMVCFSWGRDCCTWRSSISVRNCGDFYVYKLTNAPVCKLRYCGNGNSEGTTTTTPTTTPAYPAEPMSGFGIVCLSAEMHVHIGRRSLPRWVNPSLLRLDDARCGVTRVTDDEIMLATPLDSCGTMRRTREDGTVSFQNKVVAEFGEGNKRSFAEFPFRCMYRKVTSLKEMVHLQPLFKEGLAMDSTMNEEDQTLNRFISE